jgi:hypothetical protein
MKRDEFVFAIPGDPERRIMTFAEMDEILLKDIHGWEDRVRAGFVEVFIKNPTFTNNQDKVTNRPLKSLGLFSIFDLRGKFG